MQPSLPSTRISLPVSMRPQPDGRSCGPTSLQAVYDYHDDQLGVHEIIEAIPQLETGGTLAVQLGCHALCRGYAAEIYTLNLQLFDPSWFHVPRPDLAERLRAQAEHKSHDAKLVHATDQYLDFLALGGRVELEVLDEGLIHRFLMADRPVLTGLSATFLYDEAREHGDDDRPDDVRGEPTGHFVVVCGHDPLLRTVEVVDPWPFADGQRHELSFDRLACAILLGVLTYDANLLVLHPKR
ncbi:MAG: hypothetical protein H6712_29150 [Myxococcales bacterium]|nr:hypothetical protein [Myxococcales bacterium]MCB9717952.1 hypothetical protein [Myxococcales bacterium]